MELLKKYLLNQVYQFWIKWTLIASVVGGVVGAASAFFLITLEWATNFREANFALLYFLPVVGFVVGYVYLKWGSTVEAGNNLLIDEIHQPTKVISWRMAPLVYGGTILSHLFGGSAGREGTALQMAGSLADQLNIFIKLTPKDRSVLLISAVAAGFGSVFGTPIAGVLFGLEIFFIGKVNYKAMFPALVAALVADRVTLLLGATHTHYEIVNIPNINFNYITVAIGAGVIFGLIGKFFSLAMLYVGRFFKSRVVYAPLRPFIGGLIVVVAALLLQTTQYLGLGIPTIVASFGEVLPWYVFLLKIAFTVVTLASGFKGGEVTPLFFIGATLGSAIAAFLPLPVDLLAGMGFVAVFAAATNTPIACVFMGIELFGGGGVVYMAIACIVSFFISGNTSIYTRQKIGIEKTQFVNSFENKRINEL